MNAHISIIALNDKYKCNINLYLHMLISQAFGIISFVAFLLFCFGVLAVACGAFCGAATTRRSRDDTLLSDSEGSPVSPKSPG